MSNKVQWSYVERVFCVLLGTVHILLGIATGLGGAERMPPPGYIPLLQLSGGVVWPYGTAWAIGGVIMIVAKGQWRLVGVGLVVLISNLWASLFAVAAHNNPAAPFTPIAAYGGYGLMNGVLFALMVMHARREDEAD